MKRAVTFISNLIVTLHFKVLVFKIIGSQDELLEKEQNYFAIVVVVVDDTAVTAAVVDVTAAVVIV